MPPLAVAVLYGRVGRQTPNPNELGKCAGKNPVAAPDPRRRMADLEAARVPTEGNAALASVGPVPGWSRSGSR